VIVLVTGTGTEVGKTWVTAVLARRLRERDVRVRAHKPVQSFDPEDARTDAHVLAATTHVTPEDVCPPERWLPMAMAPPIAAALLDRAPFTIADLVAGIPRTPGVVLVEGAGGVRSPLAADGDTVDLARACRPDLVLLVADAGLGTINLVRLSVAALGGSSPLLVYLNRFDADDVLHERNAGWLRAREGLEVATDPEALVTRVDALVARVERR
jgi:dethiobiotin synthetase